ncbi:glycosyltransferase family 2 protein [Candidatus Saccharibacteria bacterium]|nr:glycosyltransferase family 2 protein [Candidatus Saccharibacteria bacterium]MBR0424035.1 glycosyltransferase family 2 protein [Candidatus Saccharibacteria bacterium]
MIDKNDQTAYIKYLEERLDKLSKNLSVGDQDLNTLIDTENEVIINNSYSFKKTLGENERLLKQIDELQKRNDMSDVFIEYLMNSFWWKVTQPFRLISRQIKNHRSYPTFNFSSIEKIKDEIKIIIYATSADDSLTKQIQNLREQTGFSKLKFIIVDLSSSNQIAEIAESAKITYINLVAANSSITLAKNLANGKAKYVAYLSQGTYVNDSDWLYKMVQPVVENYALSSVLYNKQTSMIEKVKAETFFSELKSRIVKIGRYECMYLPADRNGVQYIPPIVMNGISAIVKRH